jgi:hypothetical protein
VQARVKLFWPLCSAVPLVAFTLLVGCNAVREVERQLLASTPSDLVYVAASEGLVVVYAIDPKGSFRRITSTQMPITHIKKMRVWKGRFLLFGGPIHPLSNGPIDAPLYVQALNQDGSFAGEPIPMLESVGEEFEIDPASDSLFVNRRESNVPSGSRQSVAAVITRYQMVEDGRSLAGEEVSHFKIQVCAGYLCYSSIRMGRVASGAEMLWVHYANALGSVGTQHSQLAYPFDTGPPQEYPFGTVYPGPKAWISDDSEGWQQRNMFYSDTGRRIWSPNQVIAFRLTKPLKTIWHCTSDESYRVSPGIIIHPGCNVYRLIPDPDGDTLLVTTQDGKLWTFPLDGEGVPQTPVGASADFPYFATEMRVTKFSRLLIGFEEGNSARRYPVQMPSQLFVYRLHGAAAAPESVPGLPEIPNITAIAVH